MCDNDSSMPAGEINRCPHCDDLGGHNAYPSQPCPKCGKAPRESPTEYEAKASKAIAAEQATIRKWGQR